MVPQTVLRAVCFFVLCNRHWFNRVPGAHRGECLCLPFTFTLTLVMPIVTVTLKKINTRHTHRDSGCGGRGQSLTTGPKEPRVWANHQKVGTTITKLVQKYLNHPDSPQNLRIALEFQGSSGPVQTRRFYGFYSRRSWVRTLQKSLSKV